MSDKRILTNPSPAEMPPSADVVIIGGGPAGTGALWALERAHPGIRIVLIEKGRQLASGASNASLENFRTAWNALCNVRLMERSIHIFHHADEFFGEVTQLGVKVRGYLFCGFNADHAAKLKSDVDHYHALGLSHLEYLEDDEVQHRFGWLGKKLIAAKYDPQAGWIDSYALVNALAKGGKNATILQEIADVTIRVVSGRVVGVDTPNGAIAAPAVLIAAGADSRPIARSAGVELPIVMRPRQSFTTPWRHPEFPADGPMVIGSAPFPHVRPEAQTGAIFGWEYSWNDKKSREPGEPAQRELTDPVYPTDQWKDPRFPSLALTLFARQFGHEVGGFASNQYLRGVDHRAGYYVYRDDTAAYERAANGEHIPYESQRAILDEHPEVIGLFLSIAHVGHGIMSAPAAGEIVAAKILRQSLPDPVFADFGYNVHFVENDSSGLASDEAVADSS
jgi:sarcosine oxidase subunit beta